MVHMHILEPTLEPKVQSQYLAADATMDVRATRPTAVRGPTSLHRPAGPSRRTKSYGLGQLGLADAHSAD